MTNMGFNIHVGEPLSWREVERVEADKAVRKAKLGEACVIDGIAPEILKYENVLVEFMLSIYNIAWKLGEVPET